MGPRVLLVTAMVAAAVAAAGADVAADRAECSDKLVALATCLTFVQGQGQAPTPDCCGGLKTVLQTSPKCLCVLVKDRDDPGLDLKLNVTRALGLPAACSAPANISDCPRLLHLPPNSKDAQVFEQFAKQQAAQSSPSGAPSAPSTGAQKSAATGMRWLGVGGVGVAARAAALLFFAVPFLLLES
ncbi:non-specific lipid transfer protein GPI-anchored 14-like [Hordeum vulgare subsp. vulgare]|uniref:Bifunctional inhibitor/plant lipid transfer protein/seed storage helical domain-containing protein n=2 Tax=Hordeum vulgare subsp. vulgare TaxID=112509 RepID=A0A8I6Y3H9_HORVV|nr:non-specific lipid transfer protein GPI-anchored 14-like [Hordeum vulgare subsp. vulgare]